MSRVISLNEVKNSAFLASESYKHAVDKIENSKTEILKNGIITNPATNSSFEVFNPKNEITNINVIGEVELGLSNI